MNHNCSIAIDDNFLPNTYVIWHRYDDNPAKEEDDAASATEEEDWEEDNERSERIFGYNPDREVDVWTEYQSAMQDPMLAY